MPSFKLDPNKIDEIIDQIPIADLETFVAKVLKAHTEATSNDMFAVNANFAIRELLMKVH